MGNESKLNTPKLGVRTCCSGTTSCGAVRRPQDKCCRSSTKKKDETRKNMMTHGKIMLTAADQLKSEVGLTPYNSPGALCLLAGTDLTDGVWYPMGGRVWRWGWKESLRQKGWAGNSGEEGILKDKTLIYVLFCVRRIYIHAHAHICTYIYIYIHINIYIQYTTYERCGLKHRIYC